MTFEIGSMVIYVGKERTIMFDIWLESDDARSIHIRFVNVLIVISRPSYTG